MERFLEWGVESPAETKFHIVVGIIKSISSTFLHNVRFILSFAVIRIKYYG